MNQKTLEGVLHPDGHITLPQEALPDHPVRVMVTLIDADDDKSLAQPGDYLEKLTDYEERLARGEIQWQ